MRFLIVSDLHANPWALHAVERAAGAIDYVVCAGDVVSYGPDPSACIAWLRERDAIVVRGNHDNAVGFNMHPHASPPKAPLALALRDWTRNHLSPNELWWLRSLPVRLMWECDEISFSMVHGTPLDPLYDYRMIPQVSEWQIEELLIGAQADLIIAGHTHLPFIRQHRQRRIVNPGSVGQPLDGDLRASYAILEDGAVTLHRVDYDREAFLQAVREMDLAPDIRNALLQVAETARV